MSGIITMIYKWFAPTEKRKRNPGSVTIQSNLFYKNKRKQNKTNKQTKIQKYKNTTQNQKTTEKTNIFYKTRKDVLIVVQKF